MTRTTLKNKTALILGADTPLGRAVSLQLSRDGAQVILAGDSTSRLSLLNELIIAKSGSPTDCDLSQGLDASITQIREARDSNGHIHVIVNTLPAVASTSEDPKLGVRRSVELVAALRPMITGRGQLRQITVWPDNLGEPTHDVVLADWHCFLRMSHVQSHPEGFEVEGENALKAAAVADTVGCLLNCPGGATPVEVRLEERSLKI